MKRLPLSAKVALWSFLVAAIAMGSALVGVTVILEQELIATIDQQKQRLATDIFKSLDEQAALSDRSAENLDSITREMLPRGASLAWIEILGPGNSPLYRASNLKGATLVSENEKPHELLLRKQPMRILTFHHKGLTLLVGAPLSNTAKMLDRVKNASLLAVPVAALLSLAGGYWVASRALRPVRKLIDAAQSISAEDLSRRLPVPAAKDDIRLLTNVLNDTFGRLERSYLQAVRFASDASHQLKTPVTVMRAAIEALLRDPGLRGDQVTTLHDLLDQTRRLSSLTEGLLLLAKADAGRIDTRPSRVDVIPIIERCIEDAEVLGSNHSIRIEREYPASLVAIADAQRTEQILLNLCENAVKYNRAGGVIRVAAGSRRDGIFITIGNTGTPIPADRAPWIFDRFSRGDRDESRTGHGLGLSIARELASAQGGDVRLLRSDGDWTEFELRLATPDLRNPDGRITPLLTPPPNRALAGNRG
jgi:signal transduction histidine kinase